MVARSQPTYRGAVKKLADHGLDDHPADDPDRAQLAWAVAVLDDCDECGDIRVELTLEEAGRAGTGLVAHLAPATARRLRAALALALREVGEPAGG
jgi:hypothetical protein